MCHSFLIVYYWNDTEFLTLPDISSIAFFSSFNTTNAAPGTSVVTGRKLPPKPLLAFIPFYLIQVNNQGWIFLR